MIIKSFLNLFFNEILMKVLVLGSKGLLGREVVYQINKITTWDVVEADQEEVDITKKDLLDKFFADKKVDAVINCAAYTNVNNIETEEGFVIANLVNGKAPGYIAEIAKKYKVAFVHISTDYVFSDNKDEGYPEDYQNRVPINKYGETKLLGEKEVEKVFGGVIGSDFKDQSLPAYIVRTSWLFGNGARNFLAKMIELSNKYDTLKVVTDEVGCPTYVRDLAKNLIKLLDDRPKSGIYHVAGYGRASRFEFAKQIFKSLGKQIKVLPTTLAEFGRTTGVPHVSVLLNTKLPQVRTWQEMVGDYIQEYEKPKLKK